MSELAYSLSGEAFDVPASVTDWRVFRLKPRGAPEMVYAPDGRPLTLPIESDFDDLRESVTVSAKYRLDPINEAGKRVENVPAAYIYVNKGGERNADLSTDRTHEARADHGLAGLSQAIVEAVRLNSEALRQNAEIAMRAVDRMPQLMEAMTTALNVASGTGLHALQQRELVPVNSNEEYEGADEEDGASTAPGIPGLPAGIDLNAIIAQSVSQVTIALVNRFMPKSLGSVVDLRKAHAEGQQERQAKQPAAAPPQPSTATRPPQSAHVTAQHAQPTAPAATTAAEPMHATRVDAMPQVMTATQARRSDAAMQPPRAPKPTHRTSNAGATAPATTLAPPPSAADSTDSLSGFPTDPAKLMRLITIQNALTPVERELAKAIAEELSPEQRAAWLGDLTELSVEQAVHKIRTTLAQLSQNAQASPTSDSAQTTNQEGALQ